MRKIESEMIEAIKNRKNYKNSNTQVLQADPENGYVEVWLHCSRIARLNYINQIIEFDDCGYRTATTKSRLNALINAFTRPGQAIYQRNHTWFWGNGQAWDGGGLAMIRM